MYLTLHSRFFLAVVLGTFLFLHMFPAEVSMSPGLLDSTDVLGPQNLVPKPTRQSTAKTLWCWEHFFFGNLSWISTDAIAVQVARCEALETEGAFHFVGISAPTRRIDALQMAFPCIFGVFCHWVLVCVGRTCKNFM